MERIRKVKDQGIEMHISDLHNKTFQVRLKGTRSVNYLYFIKAGLYELEDYLGPRACYYSDDDDYYDEWVGGIKKFFKNDSDVYTYKEILLEVLLTSKHKVWREFAKKRVRGNSNENVEVL